MSIKLDIQDRIILTYLQRNVKTPLESLSGASGLSVASIQRRVKRMRRAKVIQDEVAIVDPASVGMTVTCVVMVELERDSFTLLDGFRQNVQLEPQVQQCYSVTGSADFALICIARDMKDFEVLTQRLLTKNPNVRRFSSSVVMERTKVGLSVLT